MSTYSQDSLMELDSSLVSSIFFYTTVPYYLWRFEQKPQIKIFCTYSYFCSVFVWVFRLRLSIETLTMEHINRLNFNKFKKEQNLDSHPVCRFGPGGDFSYSWLPDNDFMGHKANRLTNILRSIAEIITAVASPENISARKENLDDINKKQFRPQDYAQTIRIAQSDLKLHKEPMLFSDDIGTGRPTEHKPKHRIRTHRRTPKKAVTDSLPGQSTLFDCNLQGAKTA